VRLLAVAASQARAQLKTTSCWGFTRHRSHRCIPVSLSLQRSV
jgi:hypothetical protein